MKEALLHGWRNGKYGFYFMLAIAAFFSIHISIADNRVYLIPFYWVLPIVVYMIIVAIIYAKRNQKDKNRNIKGT